MTFSECQHNQCRRAGYIRSCLPYFGRQPSNMPSRYYNSCTHTPNAVNGALLTNKSSAAGVHYARTDNSVAGAVSEDIHSFDNAVFYMETRTFTSWYLDPDCICGNAVHTLACIIHAQVTGPSRHGIIYVVQIFTFRQIIIGNLLGGTINVSSC